MEKLYEAKINYTETNFDEDRDLDQLIHPYVSVCFVVALLQIQTLFHFGKLNVFATFRIQT